MAQRAVKLRKGLHVPSPVARLSRVWVYSSVPATLTSGERGLMAAAETELTTARRVARTEAENFISVETRWRRARRC